MVSLQEYAHCPPETSQVSDWLGGGLRATLGLFGAGEVLCFECPFDFADEVAAGEFEDLTGTSFRARICGLRTL